MLTAKDAARAAVDASCDTGKPTTVRRTPGLEDALLCLGCEDQWTNEDDHEVYVGSLDGWSWHVRVTS